MESYQETELCWWLHRAVGRGRKPGPIPTLNELGTEVNQAEPRLYADECDLKPRSPKAGSQWDWNNIFVSGIYKGAFPISHAHTLWVSTSLTQVTPSLCLPSLPGREFLCFEGHRRCHFFWEAFSGPHVQLPQLCSPFLVLVSVRARHNSSHPFCEAVGTWGRALSYAPLHTTQGTQWHTGCVCCLEHLSVHWKHDHCYWHWRPAWASLLLGAAHSSFWFLPLAWDVYPPSIPHRLSSLDCPTPSVSFIDLDRRFLFLAELSPSKVFFREGSMANEQMSRRVPGAILFFTSWHHYLPVMWLWKSWLNIFVS